MGRGTRLTMFALMGSMAALAAAPGAGATTFTNPAPITIPVGVSNASPYPSQIAVSGIPGPVTDVNVRVNGFGHTSPNDVAYVLVAPGSQALKLSDGAGDASDVTGINLILDDSAAAPLPDSTPLLSGTFRPAAYYSGSSFGPPGPGSTYGNPGPIPAGTATLASVFNGIEANGTWSLFVKDFGSMDAGQIASGWSLEIQPSPAATPTPPEPTPTAKKKCKKKKKRSAAAAKKKCKKKRK